MNKVKIFVCCHKPDTVISNDVYTPLHVGRAQSKFKEEMKNMIGDDTGCNISEKNPYYSEATGIYWIWKNVHDTEYVGLCHYRRFFEPTFTAANIDSFFEDGTDVLMVGPEIRTQNRWNMLLTYIDVESLLIMKDVINKLYPEYNKTLQEFSRSYIDYAFNMVVCKKELYDKYAEWMFTITQETEKYIRIPSYSNRKRVWAYMTEFLTPVFFLHNCKIKALPYIKEGKPHHLSFKKKCLIWALQNLIYPKLKNKPLSTDTSIRRGMKADGIEVK